MSDGSSIDIDARVAYAREHFGEQTFSPSGGFVLRKGQSLPTLEWDHPEIVGRLLTDTAIPTRWFNDSFDEVHVAHRTGRYYVYGEAPAPSGPALRAAMTCMCVSRGTDLSQLAEEFCADALSCLDDSERAERIRKIIDSWAADEQGIISLCGKLESAPPHEESRTAQWQMENATRMVQLKRKLMGYDSRPPVDVSPRSIADCPAPELTPGTAIKAGVGDRYAEELAATFDAWYAASSEPMSVVVSRNNVAFFSRSYGQLEGQPVTTDTPMLLHSAMKPVLGLQLAMYLDRRIVSLDEPIGNYLPDFDTEQDRDLTFRCGHVHNTGIAFPWELAFSRLFYFHTWHESLIAHCPRKWRAGTRHDYGVVGIILAVRALELLRGINYWDALEQDMLRPLGIDNVLPGGYGLSTEGLARLGVLLDNHGRYGQWELFGEETYRSLLPARLSQWFPGVEVDYGIGLQPHFRIGPGSYGHGGGCGTALVVDPHKHIVCALGRNKPGKDYDGRLEEVLAILRK